MIKSKLLNSLTRTLGGIGYRMTERIWRLGAGARLFFLTIFYSGESFKRFHLTLREIYFTGVMSLLIIVVSAFFVGMVLALQGYNTLQKYGSSEAIGVLVALSLVRELGPVVTALLLATLFSMVGILGGYIVAVPLIGVDDGAFWSQMQANVDFRLDIVNGLIKSLVFGVACTMIALFEGFDAPPTAEGVSRATTRTVVISSLTVLALDFVLTSFMLVI